MVAKSINSMSDFHRSLPLVTVRLKSFSLYEDNIAEHSVLTGPLK